MARGRKGGTRPAKVAAASVPTSIGGTKIIKSFDQLIPAGTSSSDDGPPSDKLGDAGSADVARKGGNRAYLPSQNTSPPVLSEADSGASAMGADYSTEASGNKKLRRGGSRVEILRQDGKSRQEFDPKERGDIDPTVLGIVVPPLSEVKADATESRRHQESGAERSRGKLEAAGGVVRIVSQQLPPKGSITAYVGDYIVGGASVDSTQPICEVAIEISEIPNVDFPTEIRFGDSVSAAEVYPPLFLSDIGQAQKLLADKLQRLQIEGLYEAEVAFSFFLPRMAWAKRQLKLLLNGLEVSSASSSPIGASDPGMHLVIFPLAAPLRDGMSLEIIDEATGIVSSSIPLTWFRLVGGLIRGQRGLLDRVKNLEAELKKVSLQSRQLLDSSRESLLLDRIDLFYNLIQERLDRELRLLNPLRPKVETLTSVYEKIIEANGVEGVGLYNVENNGIMSWRWMGPRVTLIFREVDANCVQLRIELLSVPDECDLNKIAVKLNGRQWESEILRNNDNATLVIALGAGTFRTFTAQTLLVDLEFPHSFITPGDSRVLAAVFGRAIFTFET